MKTAPTLILTAMFACSVCLAGEERNWINGGSSPESGRFEFSEKIAHPWHGVDATGQLRKSVSLPTANPFVTKSNQFSYAWLGTSASFVDMDADSLPDLVSPDGNGMVWFWKNTGTPGEPRFGRGELVPALFDDLRSTFDPILGQAGKARPARAPEQKLTPAQESAKRRVDEKRERELERLIQKNERLPKNKQVPRKDLEQQVRDLIPYVHEKPAEPTPEPTPEGRVGNGIAVPPGGLSCDLNSFRQLRLVVSVTDWNGDGTPDFLAGDSAGTVYFGKNSGKPGTPQFGYFPRDAHALPLKVVRVSAMPGRPPVFRTVEFSNYAMPFACDWDGNGVVDLLMGEGTYGVNSVRLFRNASKSTAQSPPKEEFLYVGEDRTFLAPFAYDWDADGDLDLFVNDSRGRLTVHRRSLVTLPNAQRAAAGDLDEPLDLSFEGGNKALEYAVPQPCDWNGDGIMDLVWGDPFGRIMVSKGSEKGGLSFSAPEAIRSGMPAEMIDFPASRDGARGSITVAASPARMKDFSGGLRPGGTASSENYISTGSLNSEGRVNSGGWPAFRNRPFYGLVPSWSAEPSPSLEDQFHNDRYGRSAKVQGSWAIAPLPSDIWEVVDESGAPGEGKTLLLRWHPVRENVVFRAPMPRPPQWTPGAAVYFSSGSPNPFASQYTDKAITISFQIRLDGAFSRLDVKFATNLGDLINGKPPLEGGPFVKSIENPPVGKWFEFKQSEPPDAKWKRGLDGALSIELLGEGEIRIRDVKILEGN